VSRLVQEHRATPASIPHRRTWLTNIPEDVLAYLQGVLQVRHEGWKGHELAHQRDPALFVAGATQFLPTRAWHACRAPGYRAPGSPQPQGGAGRAAGATARQRVAPGARAARRA